MTIKETLNKHSSQSVGVTQKIAEIMTAPIIYKYVCILFSISPKFPKYLIPCNT